MITLTATEVSRDVDAALDAVEQGTEIRIVRGGRAVARLVPETRPSTVAALRVALRDLPTDPEAFAEVEDAQAAADPPSTNPWDEV